MKRVITHAFAIFAVAACAEDGTTAPGGRAYAVGEAIPMETAINAPRLAKAAGLVVATVALPHGSIVQLLDLGHGHIAVDPRPVSTGRASLP
ncbi:MAG: hypothetical protein AB1762_09190 [Gemmatimonadota bacterium]